VQNFRPYEPDPDNAGGGRSIPGKPPASPDRGGFFMDKTRAVIFLNGEYSNIGPSSYTSVTGDLVIAVDGGIRHLLGMNITPDILIGDLDSVSPESLVWCQSRKVEIKKYPAEKDQTDFELALDHAMNCVLGELIVYGALGGRIDHTLANIGLLGNPRYLEMDVRIITEREMVFFIRQKTTITGKVGQTISLIPWGEPVTGVTTTGLEYPLKNETLFPDRSRGISNVISSESACIQFKEGKLLCVINY
jgi:thiamine pyrophosphokinase